MTTPEMCAIKSESVDYASEETKKTCVVCGDKALGYNFNAITCESCKAFFRRNALKKKVFKCRYSGDCVITILSRRYCQKCRLRKCFQAGMMSELITVHPEMEETPREISVIRKRHSRDAPRVEPPSKLLVLPPNQQPTSMFSPPQYSYTHSSAFHQYVHTDLPEIRDYVPATPANTGEQNDYNLPSVSSISQNTEINNFGSPPENEIGTAVENSGHPDDDPLVPMPKSVLMQLIKLCHEGPQPITITDADRCHKRSTSMTCICRCVCGADANKVEAIRDNASSIRNLEREERDEKIEVIDQIGWSKKRKKSPTSWTSRVFQDLENTSMIMICDKQTSTEDTLDLVPAGTVVEFPPHIDTWKIFQIEELLSANEILAPPLKKAGPIVSYADAGLAADMMDLAIRRTLEMVKRINAFSGLPSCDQLVLFKGGIREMICLRGLMVYEESVNSFRPVGYPHRYLRLDCMRPTQDRHMKLKNFYDSFKSTWRKSDPIMLCLSSIVLFDPTRPNLIDVNSVRFQQQFYRELLKCYLRTAYSPLEAEDVYTKLMHRLQVMRNTQNLLSPIIHIEMSARDMEPLLIDLLPSSD